MESTHPLEKIFHPQTVAVIGASVTPGASGHRFTIPFLKHRFKGKVYPVNPKYTEVLGLKAYSSLKEIPGPVDYVISCVPAAEVLGMLEDCPQKGVKAVHLYTARFSETGRPEAAELEQEILRRVKKLGIRLIGPNCLGIYYPEEGIAFNEELPQESGSLGFISQSGGVALEIINSAGPRGVYFSKAISFGNALDLTESDFLDYLAQDRQTKVILIYIEGVKDGPRFFDILRRTTGNKPVIIAKGGRGESGTRAVRSHTASLAGSMKIWQTVIAQAGAVFAESFEEMIDLATAFNFLLPITGRRVGVVGGGGGGAGVFAADQCEEAGLDVVPLPGEIREELQHQGNPVWDWIGNPVDMSVAMRNTDFNASHMVQLMGQHPNFDLIIATMGNPFRGGQSTMPVANYVEQYQLKGNSAKPLLAVVSDRYSGNDNDSKILKFNQEVRKQLITANIPFYPSIERAARTARKLTDYYRRRE